MIGAGMAGLYLGERLRQAGIGYTIFEKAAEVGGTWHANTYPGLCVDVITRSYEFPFMRHTGWSRRYAPGTEIKKYLVNVSRRRGIAKNIKFNTEIKDARFSEGRWRLTDASGNHHFADVLVCATGFLRVPQIPDIPGRDGFAGPLFHSSNWNHSVDLSGKRVGVVGTGSSGVQIVTELGLRGHQVSHFIRTPQWMMVRENPATAWWEKMLLAVPGTGWLFDWRMRQMKARAEGPEGWRFEPGPDRDRVRQQYAVELERALPDPTLRAKLTPNSPAGSKRIAKTQDYYRVIQQPNVDAVVGPITRIEPNGIVDSEGKLHELDVIVLATGFNAHAYMRPMRVEGPDGKTLDDIWSQSVYSYYGVAVPKVPNFFLLNGPFAPINLIPIPALLQDEVGLLMRLFEIIRHERVAIAPTAEATQRFCDEVRAALPKTTFVEGANWFTDKSGTPIVWPWPRAEHVRRLAEAGIADFERVPLVDEAKSDETWDAQRAAVGA